MAYTIRQYETKSGKRYEVRYRKPDGSATGNAASSAKWTPTHGVPPT